MKVTDRNTKFRRTLSLDERKTAGAAATAYIPARENNQIWLINNWKEILFDRPDKIFIHSSYQFNDDLAIAIEKSKYILELGDDWDDEGSIGYAKETLDKAILLLARMRRNLLIHRKVIMSIPEIVHGPNGSIDLLWENDDFRLLANVKPDSDIVSYYGDFYNEESLKGTFKLDSKINAIEIFFINPNEINEFA